MRSVKKGGLSFGLVNVATKMYSATEDHDVKFHMHHANCLGKGPSPEGVNLKTVCKGCGEIIERTDTVKGIEYGDQTVFITPDDLATLDVEQGPNFDVLQFVHQSEIDPILFEDTYYLDAEKGSEEGYALLRQVLTESDRFGVVQFTYRQKTRMGVLRVFGDVLAIHTIRWHDEVRGTSELLGAAKKVELNPKMVKLAHALVDSMMGEWDPTEYVDSYTEKVGEMVAVKASGGEYVPEELDEDTGASEVADLLAKLEASVAAGGKKKRKRDVAVDASMKRHPAGSKRAKQTA